MTAFIDLAPKTRTAPLPMPQTVIDAAKVENVPTVARPETKLPHWQIVRHLWGRNMLDWVF